MNKLIQEGADVNQPCTHGLYPLHYTVQTGNLKAMKLLLDHKANMQLGARLHNYRTPLQSAVLWNKYDIVEFLLKAGADPNFKPKEATTAWRSALQIARKKPEIKKLLLKYGAK